jgi:3-oxoadipate enol-lactonase
LKLPTLNITGSGQSLIWMHGMLNSVQSDSIYSLVDFNRLSTQIKLIRFDASNKSVTGDYSWAGMSMELSGVIDSLGLEKAILGGISMGSGTALFTALQFPEKVKALILVTPPPAWEVRVAVQKLYEKIALKARPEYIPDFLKRIIQRNQDPPEFFEQQFPGTRQKLFDLRMSFEPAYYYPIYHGGAISDFPTRNDLVKINVPVLIVGDPNDSGHPIEVAREMNSLIPDSELFLVSSFDDYLQLQNKISEFLNKIT